MPEPQSHAEVTRELVRARSEAQALISECFHQLHLTFAALEAEWTEYGAQNLLRSARQLRRTRQLLDTLCESVDQELVISSIASSYLDMPQLAPLATHQRP